MSNLEELERLAKLRDSGVLTEEEFQAKKRDLLGGTSGTPDANTPKEVALWNPNAAANWSVVFTPAFGAYLHSQNWRAMGENAKAEKSMLWVYATLAVVALSMFKEGAYGIAWAILIAWYFLSARGQVAWVKEKFNDSYVKKGWRQPILYAIGAAIAAFIAFTIISERGGVSAILDTKVEFVRNGKMQLCDDQTVGNMVDSFMGNPSWESGVGENGVKFVNVSGDITYSDKPVKAVVQFTVDEEAGTFEFNAFEINELPQNKLIAMALLSKMCEAARTSK